MAVLGLCMELSVTSTPVQAGQATGTGGNSNGQSTQPQNGSTPQDSATASGTSSQALGLADAARKAKLKNSIDQSNGQNNTAKPRVYTNDDLPASKPGPAQTSPASTAPSASAATGAKASTPAANAAMPNIVVIRFEPEKSTIRRPGGTQMNWMVENHSDHMVTPTVTFIVTGPCNYKSELPTTPEMGAGYGLAHNGFQVAVNESDCPGLYSLELRITVGGKLLASASSTVTVY